MPVPETTSSWQLGSPLVGKIQASGFTINSKKTRMQFRGSRQVVTGLLVNDQVNVLPEYYRTARAMCHSLFTSGGYHRVVPAGLLNGTPGQTEIVSYSSLLPLAGMLAHIDHMKFGIARNELKKKEGKKGLLKRDVKEKSALEGFRKLYRNFLFYKNFLASEKPLILPEGKTDPIYLKCAIQRFTAYQPSLGQPEADKFTYALRFMTYSNTSHEYLQLGGGSGDLKGIITSYKKTLKAFKHLPMLHPVIVLVDNDDGAKEIFASAKQSGVKAEINIASKNQFYHVVENLYIVKTPEIGPDHKSCIEDIFDASTRSIRLDGKTFDPSNDGGGPGTYGKIKFAEEVVKPRAAEIDFSGFAPLLDRIVAVLIDYQGFRVPVRQNATFRMLWELAGLSDEIRQRIGIEPAETPYYSRRGQ